MLPGCLCGGLRPIEVAVVVALRQPAFLIRPRSHLGRYLSRVLGRGIRVNGGAAVGPQDFTDGGMALADRLARMLEGHETGRHKLGRCGQAGAQRSSQDIADGLANVIGVNLIDVVGADGRLVCIRLRW